MAKKPFEIQGADLRLGGVNLQAGTTGVVIPGVTQAVGYRVEEVEDVDGANPDTFGSDAEAVQLLDNAAFLFRSGTETPSGSYSEAGYSVQELDDGEIEEIYVEVEGTFLSADKAFAEAGNMWATTVPNAKTNFNAGDWTQIAFRPKMRAGEIENVGGSSSNTIEYTDEETEYQSQVQLTYDFDVDVDNAHLNINGSGSWNIGSSNFETEIFSTTNDDGDDPIDIVVRANDNDWTFKRDGSIIFPDGSVQTTAYTGQSGGSGTSTLYVAVNTDGRAFTSTDGLSWTEYTTSMTGVGRVAVGPDMIVYTAEAVDASNGNDDALWYASTDTPGTVTEVTGLGNLNLNQVKYFSNVEKFIAVGQGNTDLPVILYSSNGTSWTQVDLDSGFLATLNGGYSNAAQFYDIETNGTGFFLLTSDNNLGAFYTTDITTSMGASQWIDFSGIGNNVAFTKIAFVASGSFTGWHIMQNEDDTDDAWYYNSNTNPTTGSFSVFALADVGSEFANEVNYEPSMSEVVFGAYNGVTTIMIATGDGQILYWPAVENGPWVSIPKPYTATDFSINQSTTAAITFGTKSANTNEKIVLSNCTPSDYNGTYYVGSGNMLYTNTGVSVAFDSSALDPFVSGTLTFSHGQYIDALHYSNGKFYAGNDDEEMFVSTNGGATWTLSDTFTGNPGEPEYMNDIDSYVTTGNSDIGDIAVEVNDVDGFTSLTITDKDFNLVTTRTDPGQDADISLESADDIWITANGDDIVLRAASEIRIETNDAIQNWTWVFTEGGVLALGNDKGAIFANQTSGKVTIADNLGPDGNPPMPSTAIHIGGTDAFVISRGNGSNNPGWTFGDDGSTSFPGAVVKSTVEKVGANINGNNVVFVVTAVDGLGAVTELTVTNSPNPAWVTGTSGLSLTDVDFTVSFDGSGNASVVVNSSGNGHSVSETFYLQPDAVGAVAPTPTALDLTKSINKLTNNINDNDYTLADGVEGQIMYLVPTPNTVDPTAIRVLVNHARNGGTQSLNAYLWPFGLNTFTGSICTLIFTDSHWQQVGGAWD